MLPTSQIFILLLILLPGLVLLSTFLIFRFIFPPPPRTAKQSYHHIHHGGAPYAYDVPEDTELLPVSSPTNSPGSSRPSSPVDLFVV